MARSADLPTAGSVPLPAAATTIATAFVRSALRPLDALQRTAVLAASGISEQALADGEARVPAAAFARLWMAVARQLDDEFFGLDRRRMKVGTFAMLCHALAGQAMPAGDRGSITLGQSLRQALAGFNLFLDDLSASLRVAGGSAALVLDNRIAPAWAAGDPVALADARRFADETLLVLLHGLLCWLAGHRVPLARLDMAHPAPPHADEYRRMFAPLLRFDAPATALHVDAGLLAARVQVSPASLKAFLRDAPQSVFLKQVQGDALSDRVRRLCRDALRRGEPAPTLQALGAALAQPPATLRRHLAAEGHTWQQLKDAERRTLALSLMADGRLTVAEIAQRLGFADASTLYRAFRKWTGLAPGAFQLAAVQHALPLAGPP